MRSLVLVLPCLVACTAERAEGDTSTYEPPVHFGFPLPERERYPLAPVGVDHDPTVQDGTAIGKAICTSYDGRSFPHCYDEHDGSDYILDGPFEQMDDFPSPIVAAADGVVIETDDGHYDHCHLDGTEVSCDGHPMEANFVKLEHEGGVQTWYWHMRKHSIAVKVGDEVRCGDLLGEVGSSGNSSKPHLHFEVVDGWESVIDPYAGSESQSWTYWEEQGEADDLPGEGCTAG